MAKRNTFVGLDVHKESIAVAIACRFSEGMDPGLSKPFPPEFRSSAARAECA